MGLTEADTRANFIDPLLADSGWAANNIVREHYFTAGRKLIGNRRGKKLYVDYLLKYNNVNVALIEAKKFDDHPTKGLQQAINYADKLGIDIVYSTNGQEIYQFDRRTGNGKYVNQFPNPEAIYRILNKESFELKQKLHSIPFQLSGQFMPRYYQELAVNRVMEAIAEKKDRILLTMATGTGKTFIASQIVHKLIQAKWNREGKDHRPRVLFLADRNVLADQAINTFNAYEKDLIKVDGEEVRKRNGVVPTNAFIFFAIYQAIAERENIGGYYKAYPSDFFDLVIIDECHRGSANEEGSWREILDHFSPGVHLGLTATPKRDDNVDTYQYFGKPVYEYSLKEGINDGFLTPYKVKRVRTNIDEYIHTSGDIIKKGEVTKVKYDLPDFERSIIIPKRTDLLAKASLNNMRTMDKSIVFCVNQDHALDFRDAINVHKTVRDPHYCVRVTSDEGTIGRKHLETFQNNDRDIPVILTSSKMLTTGVDARNVRNIILTAPINSMVEFKQIIGRGTRLFEDKDYFTIIDFVGATDLFYDDEWDGEPEMIEDTDEDGHSEGNSTYPDTPPSGEVNEPPSDRPEKLVIELNDGRKLKVIDVDTRYIDENGKPLTAREFLEKLVGELPSLFENEQQLRKIWSSPDTRADLLKNLGNLGFDREQLFALRDMIADEEIDIFDVLSHITFSSELHTRNERADKVRNNHHFFAKYENNQAKEFLEYVLKTYEEKGIEELGRDKLSDLVRLKIGMPKDARKVFGSMPNILKAYYELQQEIYQS